MKTTLILIALTVSPIDLKAQESIELFPGTRIGIGAYDCEYLNQWWHLEETPKVLRGWVWGFWSGYNISEAFQGNPQRDLYSRFTDESVLIDVLKGRCLENPNQLFVQVATDVFMLLDEAERAKEGE